MLNIELNNEGHLVKYSAWNKSVAEKLANSEGITLTANHWEIIYLIQEFYKETETVPESRPLSNLISTKLDKEKSRSIYLMRLFGGTPAKVIAKIAGLPKPTNCI